MARRRCARLRSRRTSARGFRSYARQPPAARTPATTALSTSKQLPGGIARFPVNPSLSQKPNDLSAIKRGANLRKVGRHQAEAAE